MKTGFLPFDETSRIINKVGFSTEWIEQRKHRYIVETCLPLLFHAHVPNYSRVDAFATVFFSYKWNAYLFFTKHESVLEFI